MSLDNGLQYAELQMFSQAQQATITKLSKQIVEYERQVEHLKALLDSTVPPITGLQVVSVINVSDEEHIAREQLSYLKKLSFEKELTLEETKKVSEYAKILSNLSTKKKDINAQSQDISSKDLLKLIENEQT